MDSWQNSWQNLEVCEHFSQFPPLKRSFLSSILILSRPQFPRQPRLALTSSHSSQSLFLEFNMWAQARPSFRILPLSPVPWLCTQGRVGELTALGERGWGAEAGRGRGSHGHTDLLVNRAQCRELTLGPACQAPCESSSHDPVRPGL